MIVDIQTIAVLTVLDAIVDFILFKVVGIRRLTFYVSILLSFIVPTVWLWFVVWSGTPFSETIPIFTAYLTNYIVNFVNFIISGIFGIMLSGLVCAITGRTTEEN